MCARSVCRASMYAGPQTCCNSARVGQQPSAVLCQDPEELELDRCEVDHLALAAHDTGREVDFKTVQFHAWLLAVWLNPSQICKQAGHEFARPKRLRHEVVRAGLERTHLHLLVAHGREQDHGHRAPFAQAPAHLHAVAVGQHELDDRGSGRAESPAVERLRRGAGRIHLEARAVEHDPESMQALGVGVAYQDPAPIAHGPVAVNGCPRARPASGGRSGEAIVEYRSHCRPTPRGGPLGGSCWRVLAPGQLVGAPDEPGVDLGGPLFGVERGRV